ncbi:DUF4232 domain-containing protein [Saccharopolyspora aridisoli]|uniref:DUF4232 domain-containing protein n=1 Tax=Saccharopolyspora aridisoli TaxID=2530385 RepID=A0A4R4UIA8_9PSEU|nr:DUF4232 domain-containing protein [Saccharopolyspora aridisoli]TDC88053.1 DUF4232 domain-containing protein [Saccharopolyspora aridisoli]
MTREKIILVVTAALLTAGLSACDENGATSSSTVGGGSSPGPQAHSGATGSTPAGELPPAETVTSKAEADPAPETRLCEVGDLAVTVEYVDAGAGTVHHALRFTNSGTSTCEVQGFAVVSYVGGDDGHQIGRPANREGSKGPAITLHPGGQAWAPLAATRAENYDSATCHPEEARGLRIYPPQEYDSMFVALSGTACANPDLPGEQLVVKTLQQGTPS